MTLQNLLNKTCLIGLTYLNSAGKVLKVSQHAGTVIQVDQEEGITIRLMPISYLSETTNNPPPNFHLPPSLSAWFIAPKGHYKNSTHHIDIQDPDFFVTWDIIKKKDETEERQHEWWEWHPRSVPPSVN